MDENKKEEGKKEEPETPVDDKDKGDKSKADEEVEQLNADTERINKAIAENENAKARQKLGGESLGYTPPVKKEPETDDEYAERFQKGEVDPLADDGIPK